MTSTDTDETVAAAKAGDESAFARLTGRHRRELHVHCYRMLGSFDEAEDVVQEALLNAWRGLDTFDGGNFRAWLYRIATNACLDAIRKSSRRISSLRSFAEVPWIQPYPDRLLDEIAPPDAEPHALAVARETIELAFLAALQLLPPQQRAVLILRDVLGWTAAESATLLDLTVPAANSALQRGRATLRENLPEQRGEWSAAAPSEEERALVRRLVEAHDRGDFGSLSTLVRDDVRVTMPPEPHCYIGLEHLARHARIAEEMGEWRAVGVDSNRMPAFASYLRRPGDTEFRAFKLDVLRVVDGRAIEFTTFDSHLFPAFGLDAILRG
ncbi:RNA polymerase subunit sigma-70 [Amycolatopsis pittospori]|uniref:RNA polymerase subunit sigma-70 n=1 Tax=Amycolatopsis pittospori TaxID=2749434 RepID=UPI001F414409|nr:RNA polymerase subunit sigma-70 [Amycolatopsis pittospori]